MKNLNKIFSVTLIGIVLFFSSISATHAQSERPERPELIQFPELNPIQVPNVERFTHRGIEFFLLEDKELPLISMSVRIKAGSWLVPEEKTGLQAIAGEVMRSGGTVNVAADEFNQILENRAVSMETGFGLTSGTASMNLLKEDFDEMLPLFIELLTQPAFPEDKLDLAVTQWRSSIARRNDNPTSIAAREFANLIYGNQTVFNRTLEYHHLDAIELEDLREFHRQAMVTGNLMVAVTGDFNARDMRRTLQRAFNEIPRGSGNEFNFPEIPNEFSSGISFVDRPEMNQSIIRIGHIGGFRDNPDYAALQVMNQILSGGFSGRLLQEVRSRQGLAYSVGGNYGSNVLYRGQFFMGLSTASENTARAIHATLHEVRRLQNEPVSEQELNDTRERFLNSLVFRNENRSSALFEQLNNTYLGLPLDAFEQYVEEVRRVTPEDIQRVAREYLRPDEVQILVVGNSDLIGDQLEEFGEVNLIDITIPRPARADAGEMAGDLAAGSEWIGRMAGELIGDLEFTTVMMTGTAAQGGMTFDTESEMRFPGYLKQVINTPMGSQTILYENGSAKVIMGGAEQPVPQLNDALRSSLQRHYLNIALNASELEAFYLGEEEVDEILTAKVYIPEYEVTFFIDMESGLPVMSSYEEMNPQTGADMLVTSYYYDWTESEGVRMAYRTVDRADGTEVAASTVSSHTVE
ncbi:MAG: insulinase family protein [Balneolaceae bacterium]|nr:MAG: insulinase family protein [Balneolaceae bacterium]